MTAVARTWHLLPHDRHAIERLAAALTVSPAVAQLLLNRGLAEPAQARRFLDAPLSGLHSPEQLPGVPAAARLLHDAVLKGRRICVYGDYDVDGITGTVILYQLLRLLGASVDYYVPHRLEEGYGLNVEALQQIARNGVSLVITVDCGITSVAEAEEARRLGLELIITDHHQFQLPLPAAAALVHPDLPGSTYAFRGLSGSGVAFKLAWALCQLVSGSERVEARFRDFLLEGVGLASLGLVADVVPLQDENRILVRHGLNRLCRSPSLGLKALFEAAELGTKSELGTEDISFRIAPRLNAVGRLGCARLVIDLLTTTSPQRAAELARTLEEQNRQRQKKEREILAQAREMVAAQDLRALPALVLASADWHPGIIGIVAGRLTEQYGRPTLLIALNPKANQGPLGHGSGRSVPGLPLHEALRSCTELLLSHGGHAAAAGFKIRPEEVDVFRDRICAFVAERFPNGLPPPRLTLDAEVPLSTLTLKLLADLDRLEPYGADNARPLFLAGDLEVVGLPTRVGKGEDKRHLSFRVRQRGTTLKAIAWSMAERQDELMSQAGRCSLAFRPRLNEWQGMRKVDLEVVDFQPGPRARLG